ncbi:MAG: hypothetical protein ACTHPD_10705 [Rhizomicrobium sp.]
MTKSLDQDLLAAVRSSVAASLAGGIMAASGRPWSIEQALVLARDVEYAVYPDPGSTQYEEWKKLIDDRLSFVQT